jgi:hypothetical protein
MPNSESEQPVSHFRLLLWLKFRLLRGAFRKGRSNIIGSILMVIIFLPLSFFGAFSIYQFAHMRPDLAPVILRAVLAGAYLFWLLTPLFGFSMNESYDPTRLFVYPVRYQTIFAANVVGSLFELSTLLFLPILIALLAATVSSAGALICGIILLLAFLLQTIAMAQAVTLTLIGFLRSRRFRDIMIVLVPLLALSRYFFSQGFSRGAGIDDMLNSPAWRIADFLPPGWTAAALTAAQSGNWLLTGGYTLLLILAMSLTVMLAAFVLNQLYTGERGTSLIAAKSKIAETGTKPRLETLDNDSGRAWGPLFAIAQKEWRYLLRDPQYKALAMNALYMIAVWGFSLTQGGGRRFFEFGEDTGNPFARILRATLPILISGFILLFSMQLTFNIFGGEGPAVTLLFSFPVSRRTLVLGKNLAYGLVVLIVEVAAVIAASILTHDFSTLPISLFWVTMATLVILAAGNLVSVKFPTRLVIRGGRFGRGGQVSAGSRSMGSGCSYMLLYMVFAGAASVAEVPAAAAVLLPAIGWISPVWYTLLIPFGIAYSLGIYLLSLKIIDVWMIEQEPNIIAKLAAAD